MLGLLKTRLEPLGIIVEPEGHMVADKRADITAALPSRKLILELKRDTHGELWSAPATQLDRFYTRDPDASGYGVLWRLLVWETPQRHCSEASAGQSLTEVRARTGDNAQ